jgi:hypothetical protein
MDFTEKVHVQIANNPRSPQCHTEPDVLCPSRPPHFSLPSTFKREINRVCTNKTEIKRENKFPDIFRKYL